MESGSAVWLTWQAHTRNRSMAAALGVEIVEIIHGGNRLWRYARSAFDTVQVLFRGKLATVFFQNPSLVLSLLCVLLKPLHGRRLVMDAHNAALFPMEGRSRLLNSLAKFAFRHVDLCIVTNSGMADYVRAHGGRPFRMPDPLPLGAFAGLQRHSGEAGRLTALFVCTFAPDEPFREVIEAAGAFGDRLTVLVTGRDRGRVAAEDLPPNVRLTGFLPWPEYFGLLFSADFVIDLTRREDCLVCGAYEAVAAGRPMILSDTAVTREVFHGGAVYSGNSTESVTNAIRAMIDELPQQALAVRSLRESMLAAERERLAALKAWLDPPAS
ncbi:MAG: hypothetical protein IT486_02680 [Gammaproteobacteria bacterium]|nr:hypothetical protein [Gammaproteobacteria bacterium]